MLAVALVVSMMVISVLPAAAAAEVSVTRDLPVEPVYPGAEINVSLTQSGFLFNTGIVTETLPEGFGYHGLQEGYLYNESTNVLRIDFDNQVTMSYLVQAGTAEDIENAVFSGTWESFDMQDKITGDVTGDTGLTLGEAPTPSPTPTATPTSASGNSGGGSNGDGTVSTPTPSLTLTVEPSLSPGTMPTESPGGMETPTMSPTATQTTPTPMPTSSPTAKPLIPGFGTVFAVAGLLAVAYLVKRK